MTIRKIHSSISDGITLPTSFEQAWENHNWVQATVQKHDAMKRLGTCTYAPTSSTTKAVSLEWMFGAKQMDDEKNVYGQVHFTERSATIICGS